MLTEEQEKLKTQIVEAKKFSTEAVLQYKKLLNSCNHPQIEKKYSYSAACCICDKLMGWWCDASPTNHCVFVWNEDYSEDICSYCCKPDERK